MLRLYDWSLRIVLRHRLATMVVSVAILVATVLLFQRIPKGFLPSEDTGSIFGITEAAQGVSFEEMVRHQREVTAIIRRTPMSMESLPVSAGSLRTANNSGRVLSKLKPRKERLGAEEIIEELRPKLAQVPGMQVFLQNPPPIRVGGQFTKSLYQFTLQSPDTQELYRYAPIMQARLAELPEFQDVTSDLQLKSPQVNVDIDRDRASVLGVSASQVEDALFTAYGSRQISTILLPTISTRVIMELDPKYQSDPEAMSLLYVRSSNGNLVPLNAVANLSRSVGPLSINHLGQLPAVTISFN